MQAVFLKALAAKWFPKKRYESALVGAIARMSSRLKNYTGVGGPNIYWNIREEFPRIERRFRLDLENLRGSNLAI